MSTPNIYKNFKLFIGTVVVLCFFITGLNVPLVQASDFHLPVPGVLVRLSPPLDPPMLKGIKVHPDNPFQFDFILDEGDSHLNHDQLKDQSSKLIKYFLTSLTVPEKDMWVNLSPYEKDRIIPQSFGLTEMGRDLLAEDYMLKQITASLIYPEGETGKKFWNRVYQEAQKRFGTTDIPVNTFNKVWIVPAKADVYENAKAGTALIVDSKLKVMLEEDYLSLERHEGIQSRQATIKGTNKIGSQIVREIVIPELTREVNEGKNFAQLRQVYNSLILASWYKKKVRNSILLQVYSNKNKVSGVKNDDPRENEKIYQRYLQAFKKGVYNYIKDEISTDPENGQQSVLPRKYFSGGIVADPNAAMVISKALSFKNLGLGVLMMLTCTITPYRSVVVHKAAHHPVKPLVKMAVAAKPAVTSNQLPVAPPLFDQAPPTVHQVPVKVIWAKEQVARARQVYNIFKQNTFVDDNGLSHVQKIDGNSNLDCVGAAQVLVGQFRAAGLEAWPVEVIKSVDGSYLLHVATLVKITSGPHAGEDIEVDPHDLMKKVGFSKPFSFAKIYRPDGKFYWQSTDSHNTHYHQRIRILKDRELQAYVLYFDAMDVQDLNEKYAMLLEASRMDPLNPHILKMLGSYQMLNGNWEAALQFDLKALEHNPHFLPAELYLWILYANERKPNSVVLKEEKRLAAEIDRQMPQIFERLDITENRTAIGARATLYLRLVKGKVGEEMKDHLIRKAADRYMRILNARGEPADGDELIGLGSDYDETVGRVLVPGTPANPTISADSTISASRASLAVRGGIDLSLADSLLHTQNDGKEIKFHLDLALLARFQNTTGFVPGTIRFHPMTDLAKFLGVNAQEGSIRP